MKVWAYHKEQGAGIMTSKIMWGMLIGSMVTFANLYGPQTFIQHFTNDFHLTSSQASLALSISTFTLAFSMLIMAAISNSIGRKNIMVFSLISSSLLYLVVGFAPNFETLLGIRALQGIALSGFPAIAVTYLAEELAAKEFPKVLGIYITGSGFGGFFGRIVSSTMLDLTNWHVAIWTLGTLTTLLSIVFMLLIAPSKNFHKTRFSFHNWGHGLLEACKDAKLLYFYGLGFLALGVYVAVFNFVGFPLMAHYGLSQTIVGFVFIFQLLGSIGSMTVGRLSGRFTRGQMLRVSLVVTAVGLALTMMPSLISMLAGLFIISCGFFAWHNLVSGWVSSSAAPDVKAYASSLYLLFYYIGSSVIGTLGGHFYDLYDWNGAALLLIGCTALAFVFVILIKLRIKHTAVA